MPSPREQKSKTGHRITISWQCWNGEEDNIAFEEYDSYHVLVKKEAFSKATFLEQQAEGIKKHEKVIPGGEYIDDPKYQKYERYKASFILDEEGEEYEFAIWSKMGERYYGPTYYPPRDSDQKIVVDPNKDALSVINHLSIYKLRPLDVENISQFLDSPASKSLTSDQESDIAIVKDQPSPEFAYSAKLASTFQSSREELEFNFGRRVTIRKPSEGNKPDPNIYLEITGSDFITQPDNSFSFPEALNSVEAARAVTEDGYFVSNVSGVVVNDVLKEGIVPIRDFDVVVEAFDKSNGKTSAGNKVYDNTINKNAEGDFSPNEKGKLAGYDILQIRLAEPESLFFLNEYSDRQGFVSPKVGYDRKIPYILEPSISHKGDINLTFNLSKDEATNKYFKTSSELSDMLDDIAGVVIYYADESFSLNTEEIKIEDGPVQKVTTNSGSIEVRKYYVLAQDFNFNDSTITFPFPPFQDQNLTKSNLIIATFDKLTLNRHFKSSDERGNLIARINATSSNQPVASIFGEKRLSFSKVAPPISEYNGSPDLTTNLNSFNKKQATISSMVFFKKSPTDEGAKALSFRTYCYLQVKSTGDVVKITQSAGITDVKSKTIKSTSGAGSGAEITVLFNEKKKYVPMVIPYETNMSRDLDYNFDRLAAKTPHDEFKITVIDPTQRGSGLKDELTIFLGFLADLE